MSISQISKVKIFFSYAADVRKDKNVFDALRKHLIMLRKQGDLHEWYDSDIDAGSDWQKTIDMHINNDDIIIFLISVDFLALEYWRDVAMRRAQERNESGVARVLSVILRPTDWTGLPLDKSNLLPTNHRPISSWRDKERAILEVAKGIRKVVEEFSIQFVTAFARQEQPKFPLREIPHRRNPLFTGREETLSTLHTHFTSLHSSQFIQALSGIGGIGKTEIAVEYAYRYKDEYETIFWVRADISDLFTADVIAIANHLGIPQRARSDEQHLFLAVKQWLQQHDQWLLLLDNLEDFSHIDQLVPPECNGHILFTTRRQATGRSTQSITVMQMTTKESALFLLRRAKIITEEREATPAEYAQATAIAQAVDGFPLALDQAGGYIEETQKSLTEYLALYHQRRAELLRRRGRFANGHEENVTATLSLVFKEVYQINPNAMELLRLFAFLHPDTISDEMITQGASDLNQALQALAIDPMALDDAIAILLDFSLVHRHTDRTTLSIHRIVQAVLKDELTQEQQREWARCVVGMVSRVFPYGDFSSWPICYRYLPQAQIAAGYITTFHFEGGEAAQLLYHLGNYCYELAQYNEAKVYLTHALRLSEQELGPEHRKTADVLNTLGILSTAQEDYREAESFLQRALTIYEQSEEDADHLSMTAILSNLAQLYHEQEKYALAESLYQQALTIKEQTPEIDHLGTTPVLNNLALLYHEQGKYSLAEPLYLRVLTIREAALEPEHPDLARSLNNLASLYQDQAKYEQAKPLLERALSIRERVLGPEHPDIALSLNDLAQLYQTQESYQKAEALYQRALTINEHILGPEHSSTATTLNNLAFLYRIRGDYQQAEQLYQRSLTIRERTLGSEHSDTALALNNLGRFYLLQGNYQKAEPLLQQAIEIYERTLGLEHSLTAGSLSNLAELYAQQNMQQQAEQLYQRALAIEKLASGADHPNVGIMIEKYALLLEQMQRSEEARELRQVAQRIKEKHAHTSSEQII